MRFLWFFAFLVASASCIDESECTYDTVREVKISFINSDSLAADLLNIDSIVAEGVLDTVFYAAKSNISNIVLPLNSMDVRTSYLFYLKDPEIDFGIDFAYKSVPRVISEECGVENEIRDLVIENYFNVDSVIVVSNIFLDEVEVNVKVYR